MPSDYYSDFYPTPRALIEKMLSGINWNMVSSILEPSAGKGDIADYIFEQKKKSSRHQYDYSVKDLDIDCIESNPELQHIIKGKGYRVVGNDFLKFKTFKRYNLIVMNPPFSNGAVHLHKALELQQRGGTVICLLNAETLKNPINIDRILLKDELEKYGAEIEYLPGEFSHAYRKTDVEIALVRVTLPTAQDYSVIASDLRKAQSRADYFDDNTNQITDADIVNRIVRQYEFEAEAGVRLIREYRGLKPYMLNTFNADDKYASTLLELKVHGNRDYSAIDENDFLRELRGKYWNALFTSTQYQDKFTSNLIKKVGEELQNMKDYDFSVWNINQIRQDMVTNLTGMIEKTILNLFDTFSQKHSWNDTDSKNIHYFNGWKTNQAYKVGKKVILPIQLFDDWQRSKIQSYGYGVDTLTDLEKTLQYLDGEPSDSAGFNQLIHEAEKTGETTLHCKYFDLIAYKKGTVHITFTNEKLLKKFNLYGSQKRGWLPPSYAKVHYDDLTAEEQNVVDSFEGKTSYEETLNNTDYFLTGINQKLLLEQ